MHRIRIPAVILCALSLAGAGRASIVYVRKSAPGPAHDGLSWQTAFLNIQQGLDAAKSGDEVWTASGEYRENLAFVRPNVSLYGGFAGTETERPAAPAASAYLLPADPAKPAAKVPPSAPGCLLDCLQMNGAGGGPGVLCQATGFTLSRSAVQYFGGPGASGGGVVCEAGASATLRDNRIQGNTAQYGAGVRAQNAAVTLIGNAIAGNIARGGAAGAFDYRVDARGGGVAVLGGSAVLQGNALTLNDARDGGGVYADAASISLLGNRFVQNQAEKEGTDLPDTPVSSTGGAAALKNCQGAIRDNLFDGNRVYAEAPISTGNAATAWGGAVALLDGTVGVINNTFVENEVTVSGSTRMPAATVARGGAIYASAAPVIANNIFAYNSASCVPGFGAASDPSILTADYGRVSANLFHGNAPGDYELETYLAGSNGNIAADPQFAQGYRLSAGSPAVNRGEPSLVSSGDTDLDGSPRIQGARVDIGAFELTLPAAPARIYVAPGGSDAASGETWQTAKATVQAGIDAVGVDGEVWVAAGTYPERILIFGHVSVLGGFRGDETASSPRQPGARPSVLDGGHKMPVVSIAAGSAQITLDGFTVRNGHTDAWSDGNGAGIRCQGENVTISRNVIEDNALELTDDTPERLGGGLYVNGGSARVLNNVFRRNSVTVHDTMTFPQFANVAIAQGGGAYFRRAAITVANNVFTANGVTVASMNRMEPYGSALYAEGCTGLISGNSIAGNTSTVIPPGSGPTPDASGAAFVRGDSAGPTLANNVIAFNNAGLGILGAGAVPLRCNDLFGNANGDIAGAANPTGSNGNISADPTFVNLAAGDLHLGAGSPCINAGDSLLAFGSEDIDGQARVLGSAVDIGADETAPADAVTLVEAVRALRVALGSSQPGPVDGRLDVTGDGRVDVQDAIRLLRRAAGLPAGS